MTENILTVVIVSAIVIPVGLLLRELGGLIITWFSFRKVYSGYEQILENVDEGELKEFQANIVGEIVFDAIMNTDSMPSETVIDCEQEGKIVITVTLKKDDTEI